MALCEYFLSLKSLVSKFDFTVLHINYHLRGEQSNLDEKFVSEWCRDNQITFESRSADGNLQESDIQNWARDFRYSWFLSGALRIMEL